MIDTLAIKWEDLGKPPPSNVINGIKKILIKCLSKFGYRGIWRVAPIQKQRSAACDGGFKYRCLGEVATQPCLKAFCRPKDRDSCWEVAIYPPADYDIADIDINLSGNKPKPEKIKAKTEKAQPQEQPHKIAVGQVFKGNITDKTNYGLLVHIPDANLRGLVPIEHLGKSYDADNLNAYKIGQSLKVQVIELEPNVKFSPESAKHVTETESVGDTFNGSTDSDGMLRLRGYSASIERARELFMWLMPLARDYYPDPIPRAKAIDEVELELLVKYNATQVQRKTVATLLRALTTKGWIYVTGGRDIAVTEDGWIELGGEPQRTGGVSPVTTTIIQEIEEPEEPEPEEEKLEEALRDIEESTASLADWVHRVDKLLGVNAAIDELQAEKREIEEWLRAHHNEINYIAQQLI